MFRYDDYHPIVFIEASVILDDGLMVIQHLLDHCFDHIADDQEENEASVTLEPPLAHLNSAFCIYEND